MSNTPANENGDVICDFLAVADLLKEPSLARLHAYLSGREEATTRELADTLCLSQDTVETDVHRLVEAGLLQVMTDEQPRRYSAQAVDLTIATSDHEYKITEALIDAVGQCETDADISRYVDRHGVSGLATALTYTVDRERGKMTHRLMARDLDISPYEAETILQALRPVVHQYYNVEETSVSLAELDDAVEDGRHE